MTQKTLANVRVVELARILAGPWCGQALADLGADVIKVEAPEGDDTRQWGPPFFPAEDGGHLDAAYYHSCNRGKRSVIADFRSAEGQELVRGLVKNADVVLENFKVGGLKKYGLDYDSLKKINPKLIYCSITGFGQDGPYAHRAGYDFIIQGMGGVMDITGEPDGMPMKLGVPYADLCTGLYATIGVLAALNRRHVSGEGAYIDMSLLDVQSGMLQSMAMNYFTTGKKPSRLGNAHPNLSPYQVVPTSDGHMIIAVGNDGQYVRLCEVLGRPEMGRDPRFVTMAQRLPNRAALMAWIFARTALFTKADLLQKLEDVGVPAGPINSIPEVFDDPHVKHRGMKILAENKAAKGGGVPGIRMPITVDGTAQFSKVSSPGKGEHQAAVMAALARGEWPVGDFS